MVGTHWNIPKILLHKIFLVIFQYFICICIFQWSHGERQKERWSVIIIILFPHCLESLFSLSSSTLIFSSNCMLMVVVMHFKEEDNTIFSHSQYHKQFYRFLSKSEKRKRYCWIPRCALPLPHESPWRQVFHSTSDQALITLTGVDFDTFHFLHERFEMWYKQYTPFMHNGCIWLKKIRPATFADVIWWSWFDLDVDMDSRIKYGFANDLWDEYNGNLW